jgi:hypothetical protein
LDVGPYPPDLKANFVAQFLGDYLAGLAIDLGPLSGEGRAIFELLVDFRVRPHSVGEGLLGVDEAIGDVHFQSVGLQLVKHVVVYRGDVGLVFLHVPDRTERHFLRVEGELVHRNARQRLSQVERPVQDRHLVGRLPVQTAQIPLFARHLGH